jgi:hypothetical protein
MPWDCPVRTAQQRQAWTIKRQARRRNQKLQRVTPVAFRGSHLSLNSQVLVSIAINDFVHLPSQHVIGTIAHVVAPGPFVCNYQFHQTHRIDN